MINKIRSLSLIIFFMFFLHSCNWGKVDAKKFPPQADKRVKKNLEEGRGFRLGDVGKNNKNIGEFDFASSNELWRATLDTIDFMPLATANYSGGIIITDWYSDNSSNNESIKISVRFLSNEVRADALNIKIFYKVCDSNNSCGVTEKTGELNSELTRKILNKAAIYKKQSDDKNFRPYKGNMTGKNE